MDIRKQTVFLTGMVLILLCAVHGALSQTHRRRPAPGRIEKVIAVGQGNIVTDNNNPPCHADNVDKTSKIAASMATNAVTRAFPNLEVASPFINDVFTSLAVRGAEAMRNNTTGFVSNIVYHDRYASCGIVAVRLRRPLGARAPDFSFSENRGANWYPCVHKPTDDAQYAVPSGSDHFVSCHFSAWLWSVDSRNPRYFVAIYKNWSRNDDLAKIALPQ